MKSFVTKTKSVVTISILLMLMAQGHLLASNKCPGSISVTTGAAGQTLCQNTIATDVIATAVVGNGSSTNMTYKWYYNTTNSTTVAGATLAQTATSTTTSTTTNTLLGANISTSTAGTFYYFCVLTDATCGITVNTGTVTIIVNAAPSNNSGTNKSTCAGTGVSIGASSTAGHTYSWSPSTGLSSSTVSNPAASPIVSTTYTLTETIAATGCSTANSVAVTATGNTFTISSNFNATAIPAGDYIWFSSVAQISGVSSFPVTITLSNQSITSSSFTLTPPIASITLNSSGSATTTYSGGQLITVAPTGVAGNYLIAGYLYQVPAGGVPGNLTPVTWKADFSATESGLSLNWKWSAATYSTFNSNYNSIGIKPIDANSGSAYLNSDAAGSPENFKSYVVSGATGSGGGSYTGGLSSSLAVTPCSPGNPTAQLTIANSPCTGSSTGIINSTITGGTSPYNYAWSNNSTTANISNIAAGTYSVTVTDYNGLTSSTSVALTANPLPSNNAGANQSYCVSGSITLGASSTAGHTYTWSPSTGLSSSTISNPTANPGSTTTYTLTEAISSTGCSVSNTATVTVNTIPSASSQPTNQTTCAGTGNSVTFSVTASGTPTPTYQWWEQKGSGSFSTIANGTGSNGTTVYGGAATGSLTVSNPTSAMSGYNYYCVLTNLCSSATTNTVTLNIVTTGTWIGATSSDWNDVTNWCGILPTSTTDVTIPSSAPNQPLISSCNAYCHNLTIGSGASLTITIAGDLWLYGSLTVNGTYTHPNGKLTLIGTSAQTIPAISASNVIVNNANGVTLAGDLMVSGTLTFTSGKITTGSNELNVTNDSIGAIIGSSSSNYIIGNLRRSVKGSGAYDYPLGTSAKYEPATITLSGTTGFTNILGKFTNSNPIAGIPNALLGVIVNGSPLTGVLDYGYWTLTPNSTITGGSYNVTLNEQGQSTNAPSAGCYCVIKRHDASSSWASAGTNIASTQSVNNGVVKAVRSNLTSFSDYSIGYSGNVLPIKLISFTAEKCDDDVNTLLKWSTATEENNDHFELEEASQNDNNSGQLDFYSIGEIKGAGTSINELNYNFVDLEPNKSGTRYYRLKQVDFDSTSTYSNIVALDFSGASKIQMSALYPNPVSDMLHFRLTAPDVRTITVSVTNLIGQEIFREPMLINPGENFMNLDVTQLNKGLFLLSLIDGSAKYVPQKFEKY